MMELRKSVQWFAERMERKLRQNDHKKKWTFCDWRYLHGRLINEVRELDEALLARDDAPLFSVKREALQVSIVNEAADVANFAMMIADNAWAMKRAVADDVES